MNEQRDEPGPGPDGRARPSIAERAALRTSLRADEDAERYDRLLRRLQAGHELDLTRPARTWPGLPSIHPSFWHVIAVVVLVAAGWVIVANVVAIDRSRSVQTWTGPAPTVTSGVTLDGCTAATATPASDTFPSWVRLGDRLYAATGATWPIGLDPETSTTYPPTGHALDGLRLHQVAIGGTLDEELLLVRLQPAPTGRLYRHAPECD
jgi:hypothetical protein